MSGLMQTAKPKDGIARYRLQGHWNKALFQTLGQFRALMSL